MRILTAFTNSLGGQDAYVLGSCLATALDCPLDLLTVARGGRERAVLEVSDQAFQDAVVRQVDQWMEEMISTRRPPVPVTKNLRYDSSFPEGIIASAEELGADLIVAGGGRHGVMGRVSLGSVGQTLLNSATVPVALSPRGLRHRPPQGLVRLTVMLDEAGPWNHLLRTASALAARAGATLRPVSVVTSPQAGVPEIEARMQERLEESGLGRVPVEEGRVKVLHATSLAAAVLAMEWDHQELALLGSARLAAYGRLFLGPNANKILRVLPVPLVTVPAAPRQEEQEEET